jgi:HAE1 family hydrophobic/amphiphilic exporter-1
VLLSTPIAVLGAYVGLWSRKFDNNVYAQIGLVMLVGLTAKNAILIVEFAKDRYEQGRPLIEAALEGARLRLRPILMTSLAVIFGCIPLWTATGAGAAARRMLGTAVVSGMLAATFLGVFIIPALFVFVERFASRKPAPAGQPSTGAAEAPEAAPAHTNPAHAE